MANLFKRIGGEAAVDAAVDIFYQKVLADERIKHFFVGIDIEKQRGHQKRFLTYAFGGSPSYDGRGMREAHARLVNEKGLNDSHFDAVLEDLDSTLAELGVAQDLREDVALVAESVRDVVLDR